MTATVVVATVVVGNYDIYRRGEPHNVVELLIVAVEAEAQLLPALKSNKMH